MKRVLSHVSKRVFNEHMYCLAMRLTWTQGLDADSKVSFEVNARFDIYRLLLYRDTGID
jgi:hypothetical protein